MEIIHLKDNYKYLEEYCRLCSLEWGSIKSEKELDEYVHNKIIKIESDPKVISILGLVNNDNLIGFISLFKYDADERKDLTPWYATMYVKKEYRGKGYSKILNHAIIEEAKRLGYHKVYLKTYLKDYYEKFGAIYMETLNNGEKLYFINIS